MTRATSADATVLDVAGDVAPPEEYPYERWATDEHDPFYVPPELRADYARITFPAGERAGLERHGATVTWTIDHAEMHRLHGDDPDLRGAAGDMRAESVVFAKYADRVHIRGLAASPIILYASNGTMLTPPQSPRPGDELVIIYEMSEQVRGVAGIQRYYHSERTRRARQRLIDRQAAEAIEADYVRRWTCPACGEVAGSDLTSVRAPGPLAARARLCTLCRAHAEQVLRDAETVAGRPRRELVADYLHTLEETP